MTALPDDVPMTTLDWALRYADLGLRVLPIQPGLKHPPMTAWEQAATTDHDIITSWFTQLYRGHGIGLAMGKGVFALDVDVSDGKPGRESLQRLLEQYGPLPVCPEQVTGSGGTHYILGTDVEIRNNAGTRLGPGLDIRGDGGQIVVAPTIHPKTAMPYGWREGRAPWETRIPHAPDWLIALLTAPTGLEQRPPTGTTPNTPTGLDDDSIAAWVNTNRSWHQVLHADGWQQHSTHKGDTHWTRPGKDVRDGASAVLHEPDGPFVVFSTDPSLAPLHDPRSANRAGDGWSYSLFGYLAQTRHHGDRSACARQARLERVDQRTPGSTDPTATVTADTDDTGDDWGRIDLVSIAAEIASGKREREKPTVLAVDGALPLFYRGRVNQLFGQSGDGKSWLALAAALDAINQGEMAMIVDWEDNPDGIATRLLDLGLQPAQLALVDYRNPGTGLGSVLATTALAAAAGQPYGCVIIDSTGEAMAAGGVDGNVDPEVAAWFRLAKDIARWASKPAVILIDHVPKNPEAPVGAIGSQRKTAAVTGAAYRATQTQAFAQGKPGRMRLTVAKDRLGNRPKGSTACEADFTPDGATGLRIRLHLTEIQQAIADGLPTRYTSIMEAVSRFLETCPHASGRAITTAVGGKTDHIRDAIQTLIDEGYVTVQQGSRGVLQHYSEVPYRAKDDDSPVLPPFDNRPRPDRAPTAPRGAVQGVVDRAPPRPTPYRGGPGRAQRSRSAETFGVDRAPVFRGAVNDAELDAYFDQENP